MSVNFGTSRDTNVPSGHALREKRVSTLPIPLLVMLEIGETWPEVSHVIHVQGTHLWRLPIPSLVAH
eukprot:3807523-Pyramimonas_sp.AAC.1